MSKIVLGFLCSLLLGAANAQTMPVRVRAGSCHGFLTLRTQAGKTIASGELTEEPHGDRIVSRLVFHFRDGSLDDETATFTQGQTFKLLTDHHVQRGPSFPQPYDATLDVATGQVLLKDSKNPQGKSEHMDLTPDLANGMLFTLTRNLTLKDAGIEIPYVALGNKPRLVKLAVEPDGETRFRVAGSSFRATKYTARIKLGGVVGVVAPIVGKQPDDISVWVTQGETPVMVRADAQFFEGGPLWSARMAGLEF